LKKKLPNLQTICITLRGSLSANHNTWAGVLWKEGAFFTSPNYDITHIVDRVGAGDSFVGGLIYSLLQQPHEPQAALNFAVAASALKHTIVGDFNLVSKKEVESLMKGNLSGRIKR